MLTAPRNDVATFDDTLAEHGLFPLSRVATTTLQVNVGKLCNQACHHCHVDAGPKRTEQMSEAVADRVIELIETSHGLQTVDITGGAPELNAHFRRLVRAARGRGLEVIDRCNLTVLFEPGQADLAQFLADHGVRVIASLPCYTRDNVEAQRGKGVFSKSIAALRQLNELGYGRPGSGLVLDLVYNPVGAFLPPPQDTLQADYAERLLEDFGVVFDELFTITNLPIRRFADWLRRAGKLDGYMSLLVNHFNPSTVPGLMCRSLVSLSWDGRLYDCDFNQMVGLPLAAAPGKTVFDIESLDYAGAPVATAQHCFGCTAGAGSSCGGTLA